LDEQSNFGWIGGYWRFANRHRIGLSYLPFERSAGHTLDTDIKINDEIVRVGASVKTEFKNSVYDISYMYSVYQSPDLEIALTGGIYFMRIEFDLKAAGIIAPVDGSNPGSFQADYSNTVKLNAPLPLFGFKLQYQITPRWNLNLGARYLSVEIGDFDGSVTTLSLGTDYFFSDKFGVGASLGGFDSEVKEDQTDFDKELALAYKGLQIYLVYRY